MLATYCQVHTEGRCRAKTKPSHHCFFAVIYILLLQVKPLSQMACALTTVLASGTSCTWSTVERLWEVIRVWDGELVGQGHGPGGCPRVGQRMEGVLIWGTPTGAIVVMERQVGHVCMGRRSGKKNRFRLPKHSRWKHRHTNRHLNIFWVNLWKLLRV